MMFRMMSELIDHAMILGFDHGELAYEYFERVDDSIADLLWRALTITGPILHGGRLFREGGGETDQPGIEVIDGVRTSDVVAVPDGLSYECE